ncbi:MAG: calcium-binding protein, partial [Pseudomonadota bacterium]
PEEPATLVFEDLGEVPADDVMIRLLDPVSGDSYEMSLNDAIGANEVYSVLDPEDPETPDDPPTEPVTDTPLEPVSPDAEEIDAGGDLTLRYLIETETDNVAGRSETLAEADAAGVTDVELTEADDIADRTDTEDGNVALSMGEAAPVLSSDAALDVVSGGAGDDQITLGDAGGFAFGGEGDDTLEARETVAALYGGEGNDALSLGAAEGYLDGGHGHDSLVGSAGDDVLEGGEHDASEGVGNDTLHGEAGDDLIRGGYGADSLDGGAGNDVIDHQGRTEERQDITQREHAWHTGDDADSLAGGEGDDTLIFDRHDVAEGGDGNDLFWLYHDGVDAGNIAEITDFEVGEDFLRISLNPQIGENDEPDVLVQPSQDGLDGHVIVNGDLVAVLKGAPSATPSDILATVEPDLFP